MKSSRMSLVARHWRGLCPAVDQDRLMMKIFNVNRTSVLNGTVPFFSCVSRCPETCHPMSRFFKMTCQFGRPKQISSWLLQYVSFQKTEVLNYLLKCQLYVNKKKRKHTFVKNESHSRKPKPPYNVLFWAGQKMVMSLIYFILGNSTCLIKIALVDSKILLFMLIWGYFIFFNYNALY